MRRRLFTPLAALSLLLCLASAVLWVRGHAWSHQFTWRKVEDVGASHYRWYFVIEWGGGGIQVARDAEVYAPSAMSAQAAPTDQRWTWYAHSVEPGRYPRPVFNTGQRPRLGFWLAWEKSHWVVRRELIVPLWSVTLLTAILPVAWARRFRREGMRRRREALGLCVDCGYDLRATGERCPECGAATDRPAATAAA